MKNILTILFIFCSLASEATVYTWSTASGGVTIGQTSDGHTYVAGDVIKLQATGVYDYVQVPVGLIGASGNRITIDYNGAKVTGTIFSQPYWANIQHVDVINMKYANWYGKNTMGFGIHDVKLSFASITWNSSSNRNNGQEWMVWDDPTSSAMVFNGTKATTFYNVEITGGVLSGYGDGSFMRFGTLWTGADDNRSICTDFSIHGITISDFRNSSAGTDGTPLVPFFGTILNYDIHHNSIERVAGSASFQRAHIAIFEIFGNGKIHHNRMDSSYAQMGRLVPLRWTGLPGYGMGCYQWNNIDHNAYSYSLFEDGSNNAIDRNSTYGFYNTNDTCVQNTVFRTRADTYLAGGGTYRYHGVIMDDVNQTPNINYIADNIIGEPESDHTYAPGSFFNYEYSIVSAPNTALTSTSNQHFQHWSTALWDDTLSFVPAASGVFINSGHSYSFRTTDFYDNPLSGGAYDGTPDAGAIERQSGGSPPGCTSGYSSSGITQTAATLSWTTEGTATSYDVYYKVNGGSYGAPVNVGGTSTTITGLSSGVLYNFYVAPRNSFGVATTCATGFSSFTTLTAPGHWYIEIKIPRK